MQEEIFLKSEGIVGYSSKRNTVLVKKKKSTPDHRSSFILNMS